MHNDTSFSSPALPRRRAFLKASAGAGLAAASAAVAAQSFPFVPSQRYPDPAIQILDPSFAKYRLYSSTVEQVASGMRWAEGPVYFPAGRYLLLSDVPNNRIMKYDETSGAFSVFRQPSNFANGNTRDRQGRLVSCEHSVTRRVTRTEHDGSITVLADRFDGKRLNSPNDVVVKSDDSVWFTDPGFGIAGSWEGEKAPAEQATTNVYRIGADGGIRAVETGLVNPNGLAFSPDEQALYVVEWKGTPNRSIWRYDVAADGTLSNKTKLVDANGPGALDGFRVDVDGNLWCGWGSNGSAQGKPEELDGVMVFNPQGKPIGHIRLPERCANLTFGGPKRNRLYMASSHSLYALYVEAQGAV
ncbi:MAG: SMP-30/gluconolactonase/LRE family protein [Comamonas sp.]